MSEPFTMTVGMFWSISMLWFLLGLVLGGIAVFEIMEQRMYKRLDEEGKWWSNQMETEVQYWKDFVDGYTEKHKYFIQDEYALMEVDRDEYEIWMAENGLKGVPDIDEEQLFFEWREGKR